MSLKFRLLFEPTIKTDAVKSAVNDIKESLAPLSNTHVIDPQKTAQDVEEVKSKVNELKSTVAGVQNAASNAGGILSSMFSGLAAGGAMAIAQQGIAMVKDGVLALIDAALEADEIGDNMELAFRQAGLAGEGLNKELEATTKYARDLGDQLAVPPKRIKELATQAAGLGGATGKANQDLTKLAIGIEKATGGAVSGEAAIKVFSRGVADPENAEAIDKLTKKFPALGDAIKSSGTTAGKTAAALQALGPTFRTLEEQAGGFDAVWERMTNNFNEGIQSFAGGVLSGLGGIGDLFAGLGSGIDLNSLFDGLATAGEQFGEFMTSIVENIIGTVKPLLPLIKGIAAGIYLQFKFYWEGIKNAATVAFNTVREAVTALVDAFNPLVDAVKDMFSGFSVGEGTLDGFTTIIEQVYGVVSELAKLFIQVAVGGIEVFVKGFVGLISWVKSGLQSFGLFKDSVKGAGEETSKSTSIIERISGAIGVLRAGISGVTEAFKAIKSTIGEFVQSLAQGNILDAIKAFSGFGEKVAEAYAFGYEKSMEQQKANAEAKKKETDEALDDTAKKNEKNSEKEKKASKSLLDLIKEKIEAEKKRTNIAAEGVEQDLKRAAAAKGISDLTKNEILKTEEARLEAYRKQVEFAEKELKIKRDANNVPVKVGIALTSKDKEQDVLKIFSDIESAFVDQTLKLNKLRIEIGSATIAETVSDIRTKLSAAVEQGKQLLAVEVRPGFKLDSFTDGIVKTKVSLLAAKKEFEGLLELEATKKDTKLVESIKKELDAVAKEISDFNKSSGEVSVKVNYEAKKLDISAIADRNERELRLAVLAAEKEFEERLLTVKGNYALEMEAFEKLLDDKAKAQDDFNKKTTSTLNTTLRGVLQQAAATLTQPFAAASLAQRQKQAELRNAAASEQTGLLLSLKKQKLSYDEFTDQMTQSKQKLEAELGKFEVPDIWSQFTANMQSSLQKATEMFQSFTSQLVQSQQELNKRLMQLDDELSANRSKQNTSSGESLSKLKDEEQKLLDERTKNNASMTEKTSELYTSMAATIGVSIGAAVVDMQGGLKGIVFAALDALQSLVPVLVAQITAFSLASAESVATGSIAGFAKAAALTAILNGVIAAAKSAIGRNTGETRVGRTLFTIDGKSPTQSSDNIPRLLSLDEGISTVKNNMSRSSSGAYNYEALEWSNRTGKPYIEFPKYRSEIQHLVQGELRRTILSMNIMNTSLTQERAQELYSTMVEMRRKTQEVADTMQRYDKHTSTYRQSSNYYIEYVRDSGYAPEQLQVLRSIEHKLDAMAEMTAMQSEANKHLKNIKSTRSRLDVTVNADEGLHAKTIDYMTRSAMR